MIGNGGRHEIRLQALLGLRTDDDDQWRYSTDRALCLPLRVS
jgi:hypothetical protein